MFVNLVVDFWFQSDEVEGCQILDDLNRDNEEYETMDLTLDRDSEDEQGIVYFFLKIYGFNYWVVSELVMCISYFLCMTWMSCISFLPNIWAEI